MMGGWKYDWVRELPRDVYAVLVTWARAQAGVDDEPTEE